LLQMIVKLKELVIVSGLKSDDEHTF